MVGQIVLSYSAAAWSGPRAFAEAGFAPADIQYGSLYDSFTITVLMQLEDLGFCPKGQGGRFAADVGLISDFGRLPSSTDGGGLCNNHLANRGGVTKVALLPSSRTGDSAVVRRWRSTNFGGLG